MESTMVTLNRLISGAFNDMSRSEQTAIKAEGFADVSVNEAHTVEMNLIREFLCLVLLKKVKNFTKLIKGFILSW